MENRSNLPIYWKLIVTSIRAKMEYKATFLFFFVALLFYYIGQLGVILVVISKFNTINGWTLPEMAFLYGLLIFSQGVTALFFQSLTNFDVLVVEGGFDRCLVRPLSPLGQILCGSFEVGAVGQFIMGFVAIYYGAAYAGVEWTYFRAIFLPITVLGAVALMGGIRLAVSAVAFWTLRNRSLVHTIVYSSKEFIMYPISIYNTGMQIFLTLIFPLAFVNFYPSHVFLAKESENLLFHPMIQYFTPVAGIIVFGLAYMLWKVGVDHYQSVGN